MSSDALISSLKKSHSKRRVFIWNEVKQVPRSQNEEDEDSACEELKIKRRSKQISQ
jgi:hypothetical protein